MLALNPVEHSVAMAVSDNDAYEESQVGSSTVAPPLSPRSPRQMRHAALEVVKKHACCSQYELAAIQGSPALRE